MKKILALLLAVCLFAGAALADDEFIEPSDPLPAATAEPTPAPAEEAAPVPTEAPTEVPTEAPTETPTEEPTVEPTEAPTEEPTEEPTEAPTEAPTEEPTEAPNVEPTVEPTEEPTEAPTEAPTEEPTEAPTDEPTETPTEEPNEEPTETPTETPTEEPTEEPTEAPTEAPTEEPTEAPNVEPTVEPTEEPTEAPTEEPTEAPNVEPTVEPTEEPSGTPTEAPTEEPTESPAVSTPADGPLYVLVDGMKLYGQPNELIPMGKTIYLYDKSVVELTGYTVDELSAVTFALDPEVFTHKDDCIYLSVRDPNGFVKQDTFFLWAGRKGDMETPTPAPPAQEVVEHEVLVTPLDYSADKPCTPTFLLAVTPEMGKGMTFAVSVNGGAARPLATDRYVPQTSGTYRFVLLAADGSVVHQSAKFTVTLPEPTPAADPTTEPTVEPTEEPTPEPTAEPTAEPTPEPTAEPTAEPTPEPTAEPTPEPTVEPTEEPTPEPTAEPTEEPTPEPTAEPTEEPTPEPTVEPTAEPTEEPTPEPTVEPTAEPTEEPTPEPTEEPTPEPTVEPTAEPTPEPTVEPTEEPTPEPTVEPTEEPTHEPTVEPTEEPTPEPTVEPTAEPTPEPTAEPTAEPTPEPTVEPTAEPTPEPTVEPTENPTPEPTVEPTVAPTSEPTVEPTEEPTPEPTVEPTEEPTPEPTVEPTEEPTPEPTVEPTPIPDAFPGFDTAQAAQAWTIAQDMHIEGSLADLLQSDSSVIYILTNRIIVLDGGNAQLSGKTLMPDPTRFGSEYVVRVSGENENVERDESLFVWVERKGPSTSASVTLQVEPDGYVEGAWSSIVPTFVLTTDPSLENLMGYDLAVSVNNGAPILLSSGVYPAVEEGQYSLQFRLLAPDGSTAASSGDYVVWVDYTAPLVQIKTGNGTMQITVGDALSGGGAVSLDGGTTWNDLTIGDGGVATYSYTASQTETFPMGMILVRDQAGSMTVYPEEVTVRKTSSGRGGGSNRTTSHSASTEENITAYGGVELILDDGSMSQLTFGEETLDLLLTYTGEEPLPEDVQPAFTATFADMTGDGVQDTLMLTAADVTDETAMDYTWSFTGLVCKKLSASGIDYLLLRAGDQVTMLTTAGFTAGLRYNMYRAEGMVSKDFLYTLFMDPENGLSMTVTVAEATYPMSAEPTAEMYYYDLFTGDIETFEATVQMFRDGVMQ